MSSICVHGLGYIGLPTAAMLANAGHDVYGFDVDANVVSRLSDGIVEINEPGLEEFVIQALDSNRLEIVDEVVVADYHIICVPTPFDERDKKANLCYIESAGHKIRTKLRQADTVILESTVPPGTTEEVLLPILEESGLNAGSDFGLAYCPETVIPGNIIEELRQNARIIGGINQTSTKAAVNLYDSFVEGDIKTASDTTSAEFVKLIQNTFRDTNIALANEVAVLADDYGVDSRETIEMANEHPRVDLLQPGLGVGGHCLPIDPWFLAHNSEHLDLIQTAREVNDSMVDYVISIIREHLNKFYNVKIAILGIAYKGNVDDVRMSPGLRLARKLQSIGKDSDKHDGSRLSVAIHDPHVKDETLSLVSIEDAVRDADAFIIATDHNEFSDLSAPQMKQWMSGDLVVDTKGMLDESEWTTEGFSFEQI